MKIPSFNEAGELPPGEYKTSLPIVKNRFGSLSAKREKLMRGLERATENLRGAGIKRIWIDGSFVTSKEKPNDVDGCWEYSEEVDLVKLDPVFLAETRAPMKEKYGVEFFPAGVIEAGSGLPFPNFLKLIETENPRESW